MVNSVTIKTCDINDKNSIDDFPFSDNPEWLFNLIKYDFIVPVKLSESDFVYMLIYPNDGQEYLKEPGDIIQKEWFD